MEGGRILFVHAHPDDETLTTGGTIARYTSAGVEVVVLTCTLGEEGEVIGNRWAGLTSDNADQLGGFRIMELDRALVALGVSAPRFLGGAGQWRDSGMVGDPAASHPRAFVNADPAAAVEAIVAVIRDVRPHVVVTYDPSGGYGHPDHIQAHRFTTTAVNASGTAASPSAGAPWEVPKLYWTVAEATALESATAGIATIPAGWRRPVPGELPSTPDSMVTTAVDISSAFASKLAGLRAHATQVELSPAGTEFAVSNGVVQPLLDKEYYVLARGTTGLVGASGREECLFAGLSEDSIVDDSRRN